MMRWSTALCALALGACSPVMRAQTNTAAGYAAAGHTVSILGVYKDGQMSGGAWDALRARVEPLVGGHRCPIVEDAPLGHADDALFAAVDDYARANGPTDELLVELAPAAEGDLILVIVEAGHLPAPERKVDVTNTSTPGPSPGGAGGAMGRQSTAFAAIATPRGSGRPRDVLQLTASLFSVAEKRSVAAVDLQYGGQIADEALSEFTTRIGRLLPGATCRGWNLQGHVDAEKIRAMASQ